MWMCGSMNCMMLFSLPPPTCDIGETHCKAYSIRSLKTADGEAPLPPGTLRHFAQELQAVEADGGIVGAGRDAKRLAADGTAQVAVDGSPRRRQVRVAARRDRLRGQRRQVWRVARRHVDRTVRAVPFAQTAADAVILDHHFEPVTLAVNRIDRAPFHAIRLVAGAARRGNEEVAEAQP